MFSIDDGAPLYLTHNGMKIGSNIFTNYETPNKALSANGYNLVFNSIGSATSGAPAGWSNTPNVSGLNGMSAGSYIIDIVAYCTGIIQLNQNQTITVRNN